MAVADASRRIARATVVPSPIWVSTAFGAKPRRRKWSSRLAAGMLAKWKTPRLSEKAAPLVCRSTTSTPGIGVPAESLTVPEIAPTDCADADHNAAVDSSSTGTKRRTHENNAAVRERDMNMEPSEGAPYERGDAGSRMGQTPCARIVGQARRR